MFLSRKFVMFCTSDSMIIIIRKNFDTSNLEFFLPAQPGIAFYLINIYVESDAVSVQFNLLLYFSIYSVIVMMAKE